MVSVGWCDGDAIAQDAALRDTAIHPRGCHHARLTGATVIVFVRGAALQGILLILVWRIVQATTSGFSQGVAGLFSAGGAVLVGLAAVAHGHVQTETRLRCGHTVRRRRGECT